MIQKCYIYDWRAKKVESLLLKLIEYPTILNLIIFIANYSTHDFTKLSSLVHKDIFLIPLANAKSIQSPLIFIIIIFRCRTIRIAQFPNVKNIHFA